MTKEEREKLDELYNLLCTMTDTLQESLDGKGWDFEVRAEGLIKDALKILKDRKKIIPIRT